MEKIPSLSTYPFSLCFCSQSQGIEPQRIYEYNTSHQSLLQKQPFWEDFVKIQKTVLGCSV